MTTDPAAWAAQLVEQLPRADVEELAAATLAGRDAVTNFTARSPAGILRAASDHALRMLDGGANGHFLAGALLAATRAAQRQREHLTIDVVWTGPQSNVSTSRLTSAVVVELIDSAVEDVLLVSFATHSEPSVDAALRRAVDRGVAVTMLLERPADNPRYTSDTDPFPDLRARRLAWPAGHRPSGAAVHAKIIVVDRRVGLVGSANITGHAMDHNLECGVLLQGGDQPAHIHAHILGLLDKGVLVIT